MPLSMLTFRMKREVAAQLGLLAAVTAIIYLRSHHAYAYPILHAEDGPYMLGYYYGDRSFAGLFRWYAGYVSFLPNLVGHVAGWFSLPFVPRIMSAYCLFLSGLAGSAFAWYRFRFILPCDRSRAVVCLAMALLPLGNFAIDTNTTYSLWHLLWLLLLLSAVPLPASGAARAGQLLFMAGAICSHPLSCLLFPVWCVWLGASCTWQDRACYAFLLLVTVAYGILGVEHDLQAREGLLPTMASTAHLILSRVIFEPLFSNRFRLALAGAGMSWATTAAALVAIAAIVRLALAARQAMAGRALAWLVGAVAYLVVSVTLASFLTRQTGDDRLMGAWHQRYFYIQQSAFVALVGVVAAAAIRSWSPPRWQKGGLALVATAYLALANGLARPYYATSREAGESLMQTLSAAQEAIDRRTREGDLPERLTIERGGWDIQLNLHARRGAYPSPTRGDPFF